MKQIKDLIGIGLGPFNLSLASLLNGVDSYDSFFLERKKEFSWHDELMFGDANMQTSYLKDLVTPVDPTNKNSFLNYLVSKGLFYQFLNAGRKTIRREEFQDYCRWAAGNLDESISYDEEVEGIEYSEGAFKIRAKSGDYYAKNICVGTGHVPNIPAFAKEFLGESALHIKSPELASADFTGKKIAVVGGGQSGLEVFRNALKGRWGQAASVKLISSRLGLRPLEDGPFIDEFFTPSFVNEFLPVQADIKERVIAEQKMASDGNTPDYLQELYEELYMARNYGADIAPFEILPMRRLTGMEKRDGGLKLSLQNILGQTQELMGADIVILATGFKSRLPKVLDGVLEHLEIDSQNRPIIKNDYQLGTKFSAENRIYAMNLSRFHHGIADPQISMMAWRSATIINSLLGRDQYQINNTKDNFCNFGPMKGLEDNF